MDNTFPKLPTEGLGLELVFHVSAIYKYEPKEVRSFSTFTICSLSQQGKSSLEHFMRPWQELLLPTLSFQCFSSHNTTGAHNYIEFSPQNHSLKANWNDFFLKCMYVCILSHVQLFATPWTVTPPGSSDFPGKTTGVGYHFLLQGIFLTQGSSPHLQHLRTGRWILYPLSYLRSPCRLVTWAQYDSFISCFLTLLSGVRDEFNIGLYFFHTETSPILML